jgi:hypothetical protein
MSTIANTIELAKVTSVLASQLIAKGRLFGRSIIDERFPKMITTERIIIEKVYAADPSYDGLQTASDYLYDLCGRFISEAQSIVDGGGGGSVAGVTPGGSNIYPFIITGADFEADGITYNNSEIVGDNLMLFVTGYNQEWQFAPTFFSYTATGIVITAPSFDANNFGNIIVQKIVS